MIPEPTTKRTLWNFLSLLLGVAGVALITLLLLYLVEISDPVYTDVGVPPDLFAGVAVIYLGFSLLVLVVLIWNARIIRDVIRFKKNRRFVRINLAFLLIPYGPLLCFGVYKLSQGVAFHSERQAITINVQSYNTIDLPTANSIVAFESRNDSMYLFVKSPDPSFPKSSYKRLTVNSGSTLEFQIWLHELGVMMLDGKSVAPVHDFHFDTLSTSYDIRLNTHLPDKNCNIYSGDLEKRELIVNNPCAPHTDTISGFTVYNRGNGPSRGYRFCVDSERNYWFLFYTEKRPNEITNLYVGMLDSTTSIVLQIPLHDKDKTVFDSDEIITLHKINNRLYIIAKKRIIYFDIPIATPNNNGV